MNASLRTTKALPGYTICGLRHSHIFTVPYDLGDTPWVELMRTLAPRTDANEDIYTLDPPGRLTTNRPIQVAFARCAGTSVCGEDAQEYADANRLGLASVYHMLAVLKHIPDIVEQLNYEHGVGPGLFATEPIAVADGQNAVGLWREGKSVGWKAKFIPYESSLMQRTYFVFIA